MNKDALIALLESQHGYHEKRANTPREYLYTLRNAYDGSDNWTMYHDGIGYGQGADWCGIFAYWAVLQLAGSHEEARSWLHGIADKGAATSSWANAFATVGKWHPKGDGYQPKAGDLAIYEDDNYPWSHVEFIVNADMWPFSMTCIGGNTTDGTGGSDAQGLWVYRRNRSPTGAVGSSNWRVRGYCECDYDGDDSTDVSLFTYWLHKRKRHRCYYT